MERLTIVQAGALGVAMLVISIVAAWLDKNAPLDKLVASLWHRMRRKP